MIWFVALSLLFGLGLGYIIGKKTEEQVWKDLLADYLEKQPDGSHIQRLLSLLARMERATKEQPSAAPEDNGPELMDAEELRERTPKRLRESDNWTFWS